MKTAHSRHLVELIEKNEHDWQRVMDVYVAKNIKLLEKQKQSHKASMREVITGQVIGFMISVTIMYWLLGADGIDASDAPWATLIFAVTSFIRSWCIRRFFNWYDHR